MSKQIYSWNKVRVGDIISFRYESKSGNRLTTILVLLKTKNSNKIS